MDKLAKNKSLQPSRTELVITLTDTMVLLFAAFHELNTTRRLLIEPSLGDAYDTLKSGIPNDSLLFGDDFVQKVKD